MPPRIRQFLALFLSLCASGYAADSQTPKPNIILILADDMGYGDIGPFGSTKNRTPNLDRMAQEGMKLTSFYAAPVCTPSRAQILTGCYAKRVSLPDVIFPAAPIGLSSKEHSIAELLKTQGYATMAIGKWHVGDHPDFLPTRHGFDEYFGLPYSNDMGGGQKGSHAPANGKRDTRPPLPLVRGGEVIETVTPEGQDKLTARYTEEALRFIDQHRKEPFFLYLPHTAVHVPIHPGEAFRGKSANGLYGDWVEEVDWSVGQILAKVSELWLAEKTLVIFTSDNGPWLTQGKNGGDPGPLRGGKGGTYEGGVREPTIAWWPGQVPAGAVNDAPVGNIDFLPTFVKLAGGTVPPDNKIDGLDISAVLLGKSKDSPHEAHYYFISNRLQAVRSGPWKLAVTRQNECKVKYSAAPNDDGEPFSPILYNLDQDIGETKDVAGEHPDIVKRLQSFISEMDVDLGVKQLGPGVRPPGRVKNPVGLWLPGHEPSAEVLAANYDIPNLDELAVGDELRSAQAPQLSGKPLTISLDVSAKSHSGVLVAQGGSVNGYAIHLKDGHLVFTVREDKKPTVITSTNQVPDSKFRVEARLTRDGSMSLAIDGTTVASGQAAGLFHVQPAEDFCVGHDNGAPVGDYESSEAFRGIIDHLKISTE